MLVQGFWLPYFAHLSICFLPCLPYSYLFLLCLTFNLALLLYSACLPDLFSAPTLLYPVKSVYHTILYQPPTLQLKLIVLALVNVYCQAEQALNVVF